MVKRVTLIDGENCLDSFLHHSCLKDERVIIFLGANQPVDYDQLIHGHEVIKCNAVGSNALDFQLCATAGRLLWEYENDNEFPEFVIRSNDAGFDSLVSWIRSMGFESRREQYRLSCVRKNNKDGLGYKIVELVGRLLLAERPDTIEKLELCIRKHMEHRWKLLPGKKPHGSDRATIEKAVMYMVSVSMAYVDQESNVYWLAK